MYSPDRNSFGDLARTPGEPGVGTLVPVVRELLADLETPVSAYLKLAQGHTHAFLLESVEGGEQLAHYSFVGTDPRAVATFAGGTGRMVHADGSIEQLDSPDPLDLVEREQRAVAITDPALPRFVGGAVGYLGYECAQLWERLPAPETDALGMPDAVLLFADTLLVFDHVRHRNLVIALARVEEGASTAPTDAELDAAYADATRRIDAVVARLSTPTPAVQLGDTTGASLSGGVVAPTDCNTTREGYLAAVEQAKSHIAAGDIIQAVVSQRWSRPTAVEPFAVYRALRRVNPSPYMYFLQLGGLAVVGASPELLVQVQGRVVATHPIAGTRPRGTTPAADAAFEVELRADPKECAEHVMLVDLGRNDIGRVAAPGTVEVTALMEVERYSHVMHLSSHVRAELRDGCTAADALRACFPAGTVSGAPKIRAMELLAELEPDRRGPYAGAVGYFGYDGNLDTAITIRTMFLQGGVASVQAGAGIVADSIPEHEYEETRNKARAMLRALDLAEHLTRASQAAAR